MKAKEKIDSPFGRYHQRDNPNAFLHESKPDADGDIVRVRNLPPSPNQSWVRLSVIEGDGPKWVAIDLPPLEAYHLALALLYGSRLVQEHEEVGTPWMLESLTVVHPDEQS